MATSAQTVSSREVLTAVAGLMGIPYDPTIIFDVVREGDKVILPAGAHIPDVVKSLNAKFAEETQIVKVRASVNCPPWDGAMALQEAIREELGMVIQNETTVHTMFGSYKEPAGEMEVEIGYGKTATVQWGEFQLPGMGEATAETGFSYDKGAGSYSFNVTIQCIRLYKARAQKVLDAMRKNARTKSLHQGKAFTIRYFDKDGDMVPTPKPQFFPLDVEMPIFRRELEAAIERYIFVPMRYSGVVSEIGEQAKRGALFAGKYGVGKTMLAAYIAREAAQCGWTFIYVKDPDELPFALREAERLQPAVVFCEDVDRVAGKDRDNRVNELMNQLDGVDNKTARIMTILTSNHPEDVNEGMRRPGRIDMVLEVLPPDAEAVARLVHHFARGSVAPDADLTGITTTLENLPPSHVREAVSRARLEALRRTHGDPNALITGEDLASVAKEIAREDRLFRSDNKPETNHVEKLGEGLVAAGEAFQAMIPRGNGDARPHVQ